MSWPVTWLRPEFVISPPAIGPSQDRDFRPRATPDGARTRQLPAAALAGYMGQINRIASSAFGAPPWSETATQIEALVRRLRAEAGRPGFVLVMAEDVTGAVGFAYGRRGRQLASLARHRDARLATMPFEFCELAVVTTAHGAGVGAALHDALMTRAGPGPRWLATHAHARHALGLYRSRGWQATAMTAGPEGDQNRVLMRRAFP